jgi:hypothetical protein
MEFSDLISLWKSIEGLPPAVQSGVVLIVSLVVMRVRTKKHAKNSRIEIARAVMIQKAEDKAGEKERIELDTRVEELLNVLYSRLYDAMEDYVYSEDVGGWRDINIIRAKVQRPVNAKDYLSEHHSATKAVLFKIVKPFIIKQLQFHNVATETQETKTNDSISVEIREIILSEIHKRAGSNKETKAVEDTVITFECVLDTYMEISKECVLIRHRRDQEVREAVVS